MSRDWSFDTKDVVRRAVDIVDLVGHYMPLRRSGRNYAGLCPWHEDSRPSLQVNPDRQSWKCWVCDIGGDVFSFVMKADGLTFPEALEMLADRAGITLNKPASHSPGGGAENSDAPPDFKRQLFQAMAWATEQYHHCLVRSPEAAPAREYLAARGITTESIERFQLGFAPDAWSWLMDRAANTQYSAKVLEAAGLAARREGGPGHYDRFRGRVLFTIRDTQGRPVALGGRVLPALNPTSPAKYINSPETPLFTKSSLVYGLDLAREDLKGNRPLVVVEGYTDVIIAHQFGFKNSVAVLGTALGERHIRLLKRYTDRIILVLDGDDAGRKRANEVLELFVANEVDLRICTLPDELDPCDFLQRHGADAFQARLDSAVDALEHRLQQLIQPGARHGTHADHQALEQVLATLAKAPRLTTSTASSSRLREEQILHRLSRMFELPEAVLRERVRALRGQSAAAFAGRRQSSDEEAAKLPVLDLWERELLETVVQQPNLIEIVLQTVGPEEIQSDVCRRIVLTCGDLVENEGEVDFSRLLLEFDEPEIKSLLVDLDERGREKQPADIPARLAFLLDGYRKRIEDHHQRQQLTALREHRVDENQGVEALQEAIHRGRVRHSISDLTDG